MAQGARGEQLVEQWVQQLGLSRAGEDDPVRVVLSDQGGAVEFDVGGQRARFRLQLCGREVQGRVKSRVQSKDPLLKAVGRKKRVCDATLGWGRDALVLAAAGNEVVGIERNVVVGRLMALAVAAAMDDAWFLRWVAPRFRVQVGDAATVLHERAFDVVYLDPMFGGEDTKGQVKKDLAALRALVGEGEAGAGELFAAACAAAAERVVVKRAKNAAPVAPGVSFDVPGKAHRFDVYDIVR